MIALCSEGIASLNFLAVEKQNSGNSIGLKEEPKLAGGFLIRKRRQIKRLWDSSIWFGTRRPLVQIQSPRPLFPLSIQQFTLRFQLQVLLRFYGQYGQQWGF